ncbi:MAG: septal ring lytic transglycosylase RlpA family protein [Phenylobacterium sp.]
MAACSTLTTPKYSIADGGQSARGSTVRPPADPNAHGTNAPYQVGGIWYVPREQPRYDETGVASWYGDAFNMKATADGEIFDMNQFSAAHTTLPLPSMVEVTNLDNGRKLVVRVNDRGPFVGGRIIDLSHAAAAELGYDRAGTAHVRVKYVGPAPLAGPDAGVRYAKASPPPSASPPFSAAPAYATPVRAAAYGSGNRTGRRPAAGEICGAGTPTTVAVDSAVAAAPLVARPKPVEVAVLTPLPSATRASRDPYISDVVARRVQPVAQRANLAAASGQPLAAPVSPPVPVPAPVAAQSLPAKGYSVQAGAFSDQTNAKRAAAQLASAGTVKVEPFERSGVTMYRVYLAGVSDETEAHEVRDRVAAIGFADARVVRP